MRRTAAVLIGLMLCGGLPWAAAEERPIERLPKDVEDVAFAWTEPIKAVGEHARQFDPLGALWFGVLGGSAKSMERIARVLIVKPEPTSRPGEPHKLLRYTF